MRRALLVAGLLALSTTLAHAAPDVIVIVLDDTGATRIGPVARTINAATPSIDSIAKGGINFTDAYAAPVCIQARTALLAGQWQQRRSLGNQQGNGPFPPGTLQTLADKLHPEYQTALVGKWHLGVTTGKHPLDRGFDRAFFFVGLTPHYSGPHPGRNLFDQRTEVKNSGLLSNTLANKAVAIIKAPRTKPLFLLFATNGIHNPLEAPAAQRVKEMDAAIGKVLAAARDDTLVILIGDNGFAASPLLSGAKFQILEEGVRVQLHMMWKGHITAGQRVQTPASILDIAPTVLKAVDKSTGATDGFDLRNLPANRPVFLDALDADPGPGPSIEPGQGVRRGRLVYYENYLGVKKQLYDVVSDPGQKTNLAGRDTTVEAELHQLLEEFRIAIAEGQAGARGVVVDPSEMRPLGE